MKKQAVHILATSNLFLMLMVTSAFAGSSTPSNSIRRAQCQSPGYRSPRRATSRHICIRGASGDFHEATASALVRLRAKARLTAIKLTSLLVFRRMSIARASFISNAPASQRLATLRLE